MLKKVKKNTRYVYLKVEHDLGKHKTDPKGNLKDLMGPLVYLKIYMGNLICSSNPTSSILGLNLKLAKGNFNRTG